MIRNAGAVMRDGLESLSKGGVSQTALAMSLLCAAASALVAVFAVLVVVFGTATYLTPNLNATLSGKVAETGVYAVYGASVQVHDAKPVERHVDLPCGALTRPSTDQDLTACAGTTHVLSSDDVAARFRAGLSPYTLFRAAIRTLCWSLPVFVLAFGLLEAARCLKALSGGLYFAVETTRRLRNFAIAGLIYVLLPPLMPLLGDVILGGHQALIFSLWTFWPPHGQITYTHPGAFAFTGNLYVLKTLSGGLIGLYALTLAMIATVMSKAAVIVQDHAEII